MASRLGQHLLRAKSKAENFGLFSLWGLSSLIYRRVGIFEKIIDQDFFVKMGVFDRREGVGWGRGKHCSSLMRYGFCRGNALY